MATRSPSSPWPGHCRTTGACTPCRSRAVTGAAPTRRRLASTNSSTAAWRRCGTCPGRSTCTGTATARPSPSNWACVPRPRDCPWPGSPSARCSPWPGSPDASSTGCTAPCPSTGSCRTAPSWRRFAPWAAAWPTSPTRPSTPSRCGRSATTNVAPRTTTRAPTAARTALSFGRPCSASSAPRTG